MATKNIEMYSQKQYELEEIKDGIINYFQQHKREVADFRQSIQRDLGEAKTMLLVFERHHLRSANRVGLVIQLSEFQGFQSADIVALGGEGSGVISEGPLVDFGIEALKSVGFSGKNI